MTKTIKVALIGLGEIGEAFAEHFLERIQVGGMPIEIVAVADRQVDSPVALGFSQNGIPVFREGHEIVKMGENVDIIFDLSGNSAERQNLRLKLMESKNRHTVIAPEVMARLLWFFFDEGGDLPDGHAANSLFAS